MPMPTFSELAECIEVLEKILQNKIAKVVDVVSCADTKMVTIPNPLTDKMRKQIDEFQINVNFLNETVEKLKSEHEYLIAENKTFSAWNSKLRKRIAEME